MNITKNFTLAEFACHDGTAVPDKYLSSVQKLADNLQVLRDYLNTPITITSGYRTPAYNKSIGGASKSQHMQAKAADIKAKGKTPTEVKSAILHLINIGKMQDGGIGIYPSWVHYDVGSVRRW